MTEEDIIEHKKLAREAGLIGAEDYCEAKTELLLEICNGIGPGWFPDSIRKLLDNIHPYLKIVADIHDMQYYNGDLTRSDFTRANDNFRENGKILAKYKFKWFDPRRYIMYHEACKLSAACHLFGWPAYCLAIKERMRKEQAEIGE